MMDMNGVDNMTNDNHMVLGEKQDPNDMSRTARAQQTDETRRKTRGEGIRY